MERDNESAYVHIRRDAPTPPPLYAAVRNLDDPPSPPPPPAYISPKYKHSKK